jgi:hypothetical protein
MAGGIPHEPQRQAGKTITPPEHCQTKALLNQKIARLPGELRGPFRILLETVRLVRFTKHPAKSYSLFAERRKLAVSRAPECAGRPKRSFPRFALVNKGATCTAGRETPILAKNAPPLQSLPLVFPAA